MYTPKVHFSGIEDISEYIDFCEGRFQDEINNATSDILKNNKVRLIYVCGPSCSGKTTATKLLIDSLRKHGKSVIDISVDDFYLDRDVIIENCKKRNVPVEFESVHSLDFSYLKKVLSDIKNRESCLTLPIYNFKAAKRTDYRLVDFSDNTIVLLEGIQTIYPEIIAMYKGISYLGVGIGLYNDVTLPSGIVSRNDIRLLRRIVRDIQFRNVPPQENFALWQSVRENEKKNIEPFIDFVDIKINSFIGYELSCMKRRAISLLSEIEADSAYYDKAMYLKAFLKDIDEIPEDMIRKNSLLKEFLL